MKLQLTSDSCDYAEENLVDVVRPGRAAAELFCWSFLTCLQGLPPSFLANGVVRVP